MSPSNQGSPPNIFFYIEDIYNQYCMVKTMSSTEQLTFRVTGMDCASCAQTVEDGVARLDGVTACRLNFTTEKLTVQGGVSREEVVARVRALGYDVDEGKGASKTAVPSQTLTFWRFMGQRLETRLALLGALLILPGLIFHELLPMLDWHSPWLDVTSVAAMVVAGWPIARSAWRALRINRDINMNLLMSIAAVGAVFIGAYTEAGLVMVLFAIGEAIEGYTAARARDAIRSLMEVAPNEATVLRPCIDCAGHLGQDGYEGGPCPFCGLEEQRVPVDSLQVGETIVVKPGERIPMDGRILTGHSAVNQAPITGESAPVEKAPDDTVYASSINGQGVLHVEITHRAEDNTISRIIRMVEEAQAQKAPAQRLVDRFARVYTPAVVGLALLVAVAPPLLFGQPFWVADAPTQGWIYRALALLVVACPCALVISTPVSIISAISNAARHGVLVKGGAYLETLSRVRAVALDKTGTLTAGQPAVVAVRAVDCAAVNGRCNSCDDLLALAGAVERHSEHPLGRAIAAAADERQVNGRYPAPDSVTALTGRGIRGQVDGSDVTIGSHRHFDETIQHDHAECVALQAAEANGQTTMLVSVDGRYRGYIAASDQVRATSREAVAALHHAGLTTVMLTGDNAETAQRIAADVGVDDVRANLLPQDKVTAVQSLRQQFSHVAMVGDGINDAPALALADVGIAMGAAGTAQAMETADIALMHDDLSKLPFAVRLARAAMSTIRVNIGLSIGIKAAFLVLVLLGVGTMWMAVLADMGTSLLVTLNGTRLLKRPLPE